MRERTKPIRGAHNIPHRRPWKNRVHVRSRDRLVTLCDMVLAMFRKFGRCGGEKRAKRHERRADTVVVGLINAGSERERDGRGGAGKDGGGEPH